MLAEQALTYQIRAAVFEVSRVLGGGFLEKVYERALLKELSLRGLSARSQVPLAVQYKGETVGEYVADIVVEDRILLELKAQAGLADVHAAQLINYLRASGKRVGLLVNFTVPKATIKRYLV